MDTQNDKHTDGRPKIENHMENCNVFMGDSYGGIFPLPGAQVTIHQHLDPKKMKKGEGQQTEGKVETAEARDKRKAEVMKAITCRFNFEDENLGYDNKRNRITNERLGTLFRKCFGIGSYPTTANKALMEQLWVLLIDDRNQCAKESGEDFFRQTVLNIIGYFAGEEIVCGMPRVIARSIFKDADTNIAKNISRGIGSNVFPEGTAEMLDFYIEKLQDGEF